MEYYLYIQGILIVAYNLSNAIWITAYIQTEDLNLFTRTNSGPAAELVGDLASTYGLNVEDFSGLPINFRDAPECHDQFRPGQVWLSEEDELQWN